MTAHEHHHHPPEPFCCCGYGYPDPITSGQPTADLPAWGGPPAPAPAPAPALTPCQRHVHHTRETHKAVCRPTGRWWDA